MRAVLSSLVLLFGSAMAIPSLLRTGQSDKNDNGSLIIILMIMMMILIMIFGMVREGEKEKGDNEEEGKCVPNDAVMR